MRGKFIKSAEIVKGVCRHTLEHSFSVNYYTYREKYYERIEHSRSKIGTRIVYRLIETGVEAGRWQHVTQRVVYRYNPEITGLQDSDFIG